MHRLSLPFLVSLLVLASPPAHAATNWSLGANLGFSFVNPDQGDNLMIFAWPANADAFQPGIRIGMVKEKSPTEFYIDTGLSIFDGGSSSSSAFELTGNFQYNFDAEAAKTTSPYVTAGIGIVTASFDSGSGSGGFDVGATSAIFGFGGGLRHRVAGGHGTIRTELRYDRVTEGDDGSVVVIDDAGIIGIKFGFDLWMK